MTVIAHFSKENVPKFISSTKSISSLSGVYLSCGQIKLVKHFKWIYPILTIDGCHKKYLSNGLASNQLLMSKPRKKNCKAVRN
jgi:hypothetical protein